MDIAVPAKNGDSGGGVDVQNGVDGNISDDASHEELLLQLHIELNASVDASAVGTGISVKEGEGRSPGQRHIHRRGTGQTGHEGNGHGAAVGEVHGDLKNDYAVCKESGLEQQNLLLPKD